MRKNLKFIKFIIFIIVITVINFIFLLRTAVSPVSAASFDLGVFPPILEIIAKPKTEVKTKLRLINYGDPLSLQAYFQPFKSADDSGNIRLISPEKKEEEALGWVSLKNKDQAVLGQISLKAKEQRDLTLVLTIPENAKEADHYLTLLFASEPTGNDKITHSKLTARIGVNLLLTVSDRTTIPKYGEIIEFSSPKFVESGPVALTLKVKNLGRTYFKPYGTIKIYNTLMKETEEIAILPQNILAGSSRALTDKSVLAVFKEKEKKVLGAKTAQSPRPMAQSLELRAPSLEKIVNFIFLKNPNSQHPAFNSPVITFPRSFLLGRYTAVAKFTLDENGPTLSSKTTFYAFPIRLFLAVVMAVSLLLVIKKRLTR